MKFYDYLNEVKMLSGTMIGYSISPRLIKNIAKSVTDILDENNIKYELNETPHVSISQITGTYEKDEMVRIMQSFDEEITLTMKKLEIFHGPVAKKDFIAIEFNNSNEFRNSVNTLNDKFPEFRTFPGGMKPHTSLLKCEFDTITEELWKQISTVKLSKKIKTSGLSLFNSKFTPEFLYKG